METRLTSQNSVKLKFRALRKGMRLKFTKAQTHTEGVLDYVHSDLWGPARMETQGEAEYFISIIDDYSIMFGYIY